MNHLIQKIVLLFLVLGIASGCKKKEIPLSSAKEITTFKIEAVNNPDALKLDIGSEISANSIVLTVTKGLNLTKLKPTFITTGKSVTVDGTEQKSTVSMLDFSKSVKYLVRAEDGSQNIYTVTIKEVDDIGLIIKTFAFQQSLNSNLTQDLNFTISNGNVTAKLTYPTRKLIPTFTTEAVDVSIAGVKQESGKTVVDFTNPVKYTLTSKYGAKAEYTITVDWESSVPHIYIVTAGNAPIVSKDDYLQATIKIEGLGGFEDYTGTTRIKGRGNSTWGFPKKPYRLKLDKKASLLGLAEEKDWVLLANYLDPTLMFNAVAMKTGQLLEMPYTNHIIPVDVTINNTYVGSYVFTEQVAVAKNRVNIEDGGTLLELDTYYDEPWKFKSSNYNLPVMIKYPDLTSENEVTLIKNEFQIMENAISSSAFPGNNYSDYLDINSVVNLFIVCNLTDNEELNHPKSLYMYKPKGEKYAFGPLWDFDWAFGFEGTGTHFEKYDNALLWNSSSAIGTQFFKRLLTDPKVKTLFKQKWTAFKANKMPELMTYLNKYANTIEASQKKDFEKWGNSSGDFTADYQKMRAWLIKRAGYIDSFVAGF